MDDLDKLIAKGPDQRHVVRAKVLERFGDIKTARDLGHTWSAIAEALGLEQGKWKDLSRAFLRVSKSIESGKLKLTQSKPQPQSKPQAQATATATPRPLPSVGNKLIEDEDERRKMLAERGIVFK